MQCNDLSENTFFCNWMKPCKKKAKEEYCFINTLSTVLKIRSDSKWIIIIMISSIHDNIMGLKVTNFGKAETNDDLCLLGGNVKSHSK